MAQLIYAAIASVDGYVADADGRFAWAEPSEEVHAFVNGVSRRVGTFLLGRRMYDVLETWETIDDEHPAMRDFADIWRSADKIVYSRTLEQVRTSRTRLEREFDAGEIARRKASDERDLSISGPELAGHAMRAGLVDEWHLFVVPHLVGGGTRALPDEVRVRLTLEDERRFGDGTLYLRYSAAS